MTGDDFQPHHRFTQLLNPRTVRQLRRTVNPLNLAVGRQHLITDRRSCLHYIHIAFPFQTLLNNLHMQKPQKPAPKAETQRRRILRNKRETGVIQRQFFKGLPQLRILRFPRRIKIRKHHLHRLFIARKRFFHRPLKICNRIPNRHIMQILDVGNHIAHFTGPQRLNRSHPRRKFAQLCNLIRSTRTHQLNLLPLGQLPLKHPNITNHTPVLIRMAVKNQGGCRQMAFVGRRRQPFNNRLQQLRHSLPRLGADLHTILRRNPKRTLYLLGRLFRAGTAQVNLVNNPQNFTAAVHRQIRIGHRLRLHALRGIHHQQRPLARRQRS